MSTKHLLINFVFQTVLVRFLLTLMPFSAFAAQPSPRGGSGSLCVFHNTSTLYCINPVTGSVQQTIELQGPDVFKITSVESDSYALDVSFGDLFQMEMNGQLTFLRRLQGFASFRSLTNYGATLYLLAQGNNNNFRTLYSLQPAGGTPTPASGPISLNVNVVTFAPNGTLYGIQESPPSGPGQLVQIDLATGTLTPVLTLSYPGLALNNLTGMAFQGQMLYIVGINPASFDGEMITVNLSNSTITPVDISEMFPNDIAVLPIDAPTAVELNADIQTSTRPAFSTTLLGLLGVGAITLLYAARARVRL